MKSELKFISNLCRLLKIICRHELITNCPEVKLPWLYQLAAKIVTIIFFPKSLIVQTNIDFSQRFKSALKELGPIFIKLGQTISTRPDIWGSKITEVLKTLQDKLPAFDFAYVEKTILEDFGQPWQNLFEMFDSVPIAAASIAQVHKATLKSGEIVAVKILRPKICDSYNQDISMLYRIAHYLDKKSITFRKFRLVEIVQVFEQTMKHELNLKLEAAAAAEVQNNLTNDETIYIPKIYWQITSCNVLTTEWIDGVSIYDARGLENYNLSSQKIAKNLILTLFNQSYRDGFFHADLHPGNIIITSSGRIVLVDFGIIGRLSLKDRSTVAEILYCFINHDYIGVAKAHKKAGYLPKDTNIELFAQSCRVIGQSVIGKALKDISPAKLLAELFMIAKDFQIIIQPQLILLQRTILVVEGISQTLNPEINVWEIAEPWLKKWAIKNISPEAKFLKLIKKITTKVYNKYIYENSDLEY